MNTCCQTWQPDFKLNTHGRKTEETLLTWAYIPTHTQINGKLSHKAKTTTQKYTAKHHSLQDQSILALLWDSSPVISLGFQQLEFCYAKKAVCVCVKKKIFFLVCGLGPVLDFLESQVVCLSYISSKKVAAFCRFSIEALTQTN